MIFRCGLLVSRATFSAVSAGERGVGRLPLWDQRRALPSGDCRKTLCRVLAECNGGRQRKDRRYGAILSAISCGSRLNEGDAMPQYKHIVLLRFSPQTSREAIAEIFEALDDLAEKIP